MRQQAKKISKKQQTLALLLCASASFVLLQASDARANPSGADVVAGGITVTTPSIDKTVVTQSTDKAIINWQNFNIGENEWTQFIQPSTDSVALNRIRNGSPTEILGKLTANGKLMVVNPNGVFFGTNSQVDVAGLIASTADTTDSDFLAGKINLSIAGKDGATIINKGSITAAEGGLVALVAPSVRNDGVIAANMGTVALASAETASVDFYGDNLYSFALNEEAAKGAVENNGIVSVGGGKVVMTAKVASGVVDNVINNTGIIEASSAHMEGGTIVLDGGEGNVKLSGEIKASGTKGGNVTVTGKNITVAGAKINASGKNGGGSVKIGGDYQGGGSLAHADKVTVDANSSIDVSAKEIGNGGTAIVWSDELTDFNGSILGTGGANGGNGGLAEVSSKGELGYNGAVNLSAANGKSGTLLLDPGNLFIGNWADHYWGGDPFVNYAPLVSTLQGGTDVVATALNNVSVLADMIWSGAGSFTINAGNYAIIEADIRSSFNGSATQGAVTINAGNRMQNGNADISTVGGDITVNTDRVDLSNSTLHSTNGNVIINNTGRFGSNTANVLSGKSVTLHQDTTGFIQNAIDAVGATGNALLLLGDGIWNEAINIDQGDFEIQGNGSLNTFIQAPLATTDPVVNVNGVGNVTISDLQVKGGEVGVKVSNAYNFNLIDSIVFGASQAGVKLNNVTGSTIAGNYLAINTVGLESTNSDYLTVQGNGFDSNETAMKFDGDTNLAIRYNGVYGSTTDGILLNNVQGSPIEYNLFHDVAGDAIRTNGGFAIYLNDNEFKNIGTGVRGTDTVGLVIVGNEFENGGTAIDSDLGTNNTIYFNSISNFDNGVVLADNNSASVNDNIIDNITNDAVRVDTSNGVMVRGNLISNANIGVNMHDNYNTTVTNNDISNTNTGVSMTGNYLSWVQGNNIHDSFTGLYLDGTTQVTVGGDNPGEGNSFSNVTYGIYGPNSDFTSVIGNEFANGFVAAMFESDTNLTVRNNNLYDFFGGIGLIDVVGANVENNYFDYVSHGIGVLGGNAIVIDGNTMDNVDFGVESIDSIGIKVTNNELNGGGYYGDEEEYYVGSYGIYVSGGVNSLIAGNSVDNFDMGIGVENSSDSLVWGNNVTNIIKDAIFLNGNTHSLVYQNTADNVGENGIHATGNTYTDIIENSVNNAYRGIYAFGDLGFLTLTSNVLTNNLYGAVIENSHNVNLFSNSFTDNGTGAAFYDSNDATLTGDIFTGNVLGINLNNSRDTHIHEATIASPAKGVGILIENGSGGTRVRGLNISGGGIGVLLDGAGSEMQFESNTSNFSSMGSYFQLQNNAMFAGGSTAQADSLDASQQTFDGVRASDFTPAQLAAAEGITLDVEDGIPTVGNVFYKAFPPILTGLDGLFPTPKYPFDAGRFSYAGRTIHNDSGVTPPTFDVPGLSLSLLSPSAGGAGGTNVGGLTPAALAGLEPAAGGDPAALAALAPAAGGEPNCGNNFLGEGFHNNFDATNCSVNQ